jgi:hypothetical protein
MRAECVDMERVLRRTGTVTGAAARSLRLVAVTGTFLAALVMVSSWLADTDDHTRSQLMQAASTNLTNLGHWHWWTLATSAFVVPGDLGLRWLLGVGAVLAAGELAWQGRRLVAVFLAGHVGATALVAVGLAIGVAHGWVPTTTSTATDVGVSYGVIAVAGALTAWLPATARPGWLLVWGVPLVEALVRVPTFTDVGHVCALAIGVGCGVLLHGRGHVAASRPALFVSLAGVGTYAYLKPTLGPIVGAAALTAGALIVREVRAATMRSRAPAGRTLPSVVVHEVRAARVPS